MKTLRVAVTDLLALCVRAAIASEGMVSFNPSAGGYVTGTSGWSFQPLTAISVTSLGGLDNALSMNTGPFSIGLWASDGTLLASNLVSLSSPLVNQTHYEAITPVNLT